MSLFALLLALRAQAAPVQVRVVASAATVVAVVRDAAGVGVGACNDAGAPPDGAVDGVWTCEDIDVASETADVIALVDGSLIDAGLLTWPSGPRVAALVVSSGGVMASIDPGSLHGEAGPPRPAVPVLLARIPTYGMGPAPVLSVAGGAVQLNCHDDGRYPDHAVNDGEPGCVGVLAASTAELSMNPGDGATRSLGTVTWPPGPVHFLTIDPVAGTASTDAFDLPLPPMPAARGAAAPDPGAPAGGSPDGGPAAGSPDGGAPLPPTHDPGVAPTAFGPWPWLLALAAALGLVVVSRVQAARAGTLRPTLRALPAPPLFPGGPAWTEAGVLRVADPAGCLQALLGTLAAHRRVVVVVPPELRLDPVAGAGVWIATVPTWEEVAAGVAALARTDGMPVAVLILGGSTVSDPGAVAPEALARLVRAIPPGVWLGVIAGLDEPVGGHLPAWRVSGPPWVGERA